VNLKKCGKDENWVRRTLKEHHVTQSATLLLTVDEQNQVTIIPK
jgi:uncharacterized membrane protein YcaP (DUF421 family)